MDPTNVRFRQLLASSLNSGDDASRREAIDIFERLAEEHPQVPEFRRRVASAYLNLASVMDGPYADRIPVNLKAVQILRTLVDEHPKILAYVEHLAPMH